jgi:hypothetical protein
MAEFGILAFLRTFEMTVPRLQLVPVPENIRLERRESPTVADAIAIHSATAKPRYAPHDSGATDRSG